MLGWHIKPIFLYIGPAKKSLRKSSWVGEANVYPRLVEATLLNQ